MVNLYLRINQLSCIVFLMVNLFVGNLSYKVDDVDLRAHFEQFGTVSKAVVIMDTETRRSRGYGFVESSRATASN